MLSPLVKSSKCIRIVFLHSIVDGMLLFLQKQHVDDVHACREKCIYEARSVTKCNKAVEWARAVVVKSNYI